MWGLDSSLALGKVRPPLSFFSHFHTSLGHAPCTVIAARYRSHATTSNDHALAVRSLQRSLTLTLTLAFKVLIRSASSSLARFARSFRFAIAQLKHARSCRLQWQASRPRLQHGRQASCPSGHATCFSTSLTIARQARHARSEQSVLAR